MSIKQGRRKHKSHTNASYHRHSQTLISQRVILMSSGFFMSICGFSGVLCVETRMSADRIRLLVMMHHLKRRRYIGLNMACIPAPHLLFIEINDPDIHLKLWKSIIQIICLSTQVSPTHPHSADNAIHINSMSCDLKITQLFGWNPCFGEWLFNAKFQSFLSSIPGKQIHIMKVTFFYVESWLHLHTFVVLYYELINY